MKKFIMKRADALITDDVITMANVQIRVTTVNVVAHTALIRDVNGKLHSWAGSYMCYVINPLHPDHPRRTKR